MVRVTDRPDLPPRITAELDNREYEHLTNRRARDVLGWTPRYSLETGLRETLAWYREHAVAEL